MMIVALFSWWYGAGWARAAKRVGGRMQTMLETFSVALLLRTLFDPFRQISAQQVRGSFDTQLRALGDRLFSRVFGAVIRSIFIVIGILGALGAGLVGVIELVVWPLVPFFPIIGVALLLAGVKL
ncbi:MAG TPA: hypothetical protein VF466_01770 [Candidatus Saccharimonadales bacterium]